MSDSPPVAVPGREPGLAPRIALVVLAVVGCAISVLLVRMSTSTDGLTLFGAQICAPSDAINCDYVLTSRWARIGPFHAAGLGFAYFAGLAIWFLFVGLPNAAGKNWHVLPLCVTTAGFLGSLWFVYVMAAKLPVWCTWCLAAHVTNLCLFLLTVLSRPRAAGHGPARPTGKRAGLTLGGIAVVLAFLLVASQNFRFNIAYGRCRDAYRKVTEDRAYLAWRQSNEHAGSIPIRPMEADFGWAFHKYPQAYADCQQAYAHVANNVAYLVWRYETAERHDIPIHEYDLALGNKDADHTLVVFSDFECEKCWKFHKESVSLAGQFRGRLRIVFKHYPMSTACNPNLDRPFHLFACDAARAACAVAMSAGKKQVHEYFTLLFKNHARLGQMPYAEIAASVSVAPATFAENSAGQTVRDRVKADIDLAARIGVAGTPAMFLNGRLLSNWQILDRKNPRKMDLERTMALWETYTGVTAKMNRE